MTDRENGPSHSSTGKTKPLYKAALDTAGLKPLQGDSAKAQSGTRGDVLLHETAMASLRKRLEATTPAEAWKETREQFLTRCPDLAGARRSSPELAGVGRTWPELAGARRSSPELAGARRRWPELAGARRSPGRRPGRDAVGRRPGGGGEPVEEEVLYERHARGGQD